MDLQTVIPIALAAFEKLWDFGLRELRESRDKMGRRIGELEQWRASMLTKFEALERTRDRFGARIEALEKAAPAPPELRKL